MKLDEIASHARRAIEYAEPEGNKLGEIASHACHDISTDASDARRESQATNTTLDGDENDSGHSEPENQQLGTSTVTQMTRTAAQYMAKKPITTQKQKYSKTTTILLEKTSANKVYLLDNPRDREIYFDLPLVDGLELGLAGQASVASTILDSKTTTVLLETTTANKQVYLFDNPRPRNLFRSAPSERIGLGSSRTSECCPYYFGIKHGRQYAHVLP
jgi:hypothetical protein